MPDRYIDICTGVWNRTTPLFECLIESMLACEDRDSLRLSVFDCGSDDHPDIKATLKALWPGVIYACEKKTFARAMSFNRAVRQSPSPWIFLCDADITLPVNFVRQYWENVSEMKVWFPICFSIGKGRSREINDSNGWWRQVGYGMVGISREYFLSIGGLNESYTEWGEEDKDLWERVKLEKVRKHCPGLFHNFHESSQNAKATLERLRQ